MGQGPHLWRRADQRLFGLEVRSRPGQKHVKHGPRDTYLCELTATMGQGPHLWRRADQRLFGLEVRSRPGQKHVKHGPRDTYLRELTATMGQGPHLWRRADQRLFGLEVRSRPGEKNEIRALEQSDNLAGVVDIDLHESRRRSEPWHRSHLAEDRINETRSDRSPYLPYR